MIIVDAHCDTIIKIMESNSSLYKNKHHLDIDRMKKIGNYVQFFAAYIDKTYTKENPMKRAIEVIKRLKTDVLKYNDDITICCHYNDIENTINQKKVAAIISIEGGEALQGDINSLTTFYKMGVRSICLTWNYRNEIADGVEDAHNAVGLTKFGREVVREMNNIGMVIDLSHIAEKSFWDVMEITKHPVIASHSNAMKVCNNIRNLSDQQIVAIKNNGGVIGINLYTYFLNSSNSASITDVIRHIEYITSLVGCESIGIGSDFDGVECLPDEIQGVHQIKIIFEELLKLNYSEHCVRKIAGENFLRVLKYVL